MIAAIIDLTPYKDYIATGLIALGIVLWLRYEARHAPLVDEDENIIE